MTPLPVCRQCGKKSDNPICMRCERGDGAEASIPSAAFFRDMAEYCERLGCRGSMIDRNISQFLYPGDRDMMKLAERGIFSPTTHFEDALKVVPGRDWEWSVEWESTSGGEMTAIAKIGRPDLYMEGQAVSPALAMCSAALRAQALIASGILTREGEDVEQASGESLSSPTAEGGDAQ